MLSPTALGCSICALMMLSQWALLGFVLWTLLLMVSTIGVPRLTAIAKKQAQPNSFNPGVPHGSERYQRSMRAHVNCVENLPVFASLVLLGSVLVVPGVLFQCVAFAVLPARVLQSVAHVASGRNRAVLLRFAFFCVQLICFAILGALLISHALHARSHQVVLNAASCEPGRATQSSARPSRRSLRQRDRAIAAACYPCPVLARFSDLQDQPG